MPRVMQLPRTITTRSQLPKLARRLILSVGLIPIHDVIKTNVDSAMHLVNQRSASGVIGRENNGVQ